MIKKQRPSRDRNYIKWHTLLKQRSPETWLAMIRALPGHMQNGVARLVWWDYFADRNAADRWPQLDWCLNTRDEPDVDEWQRALMGLGYPEAAAQRRVNRCQKFFGYTEGNGRRIRQLLPNGQSQIEVTTQENGGKVSKILLFKESLRPKS